MQGKRLLLPALVAMIGATSHAHGQASVVEEMDNPIELDAKAVPRADAEAPAAVDVSTNLPESNLISSDGKLLARIEAIEPGDPPLSRLTLRLADGYGVAPERIILRVELPADVDGDGDYAMRVTKAQFVASIREGLEIYPEGSFTE